MCTLLTQKFCLMCNMQYLYLQNNQISDTGMISFSDALGKGALDHLTVRWLPTALYPCPKTWHVHSPDPEVLFDVQYAVPCAW